MRLNIDNEQRQMIQVLGGLGGMAVSGGNLAVVGLCSAIMVEGLVETPVKEFVSYAKEPIRRLVVKIGKRG
jgi:hypothetical protein